MTFTFKHGDRPLEGYTVQRGVGRGGFGEVYYALSDSGKEVGLKYLRDNPQVELRGVSHCMNLKSPHLVTIYDIKQNAAGEHFIIMEYVSGPSLRDLLIAEGEKGLGVQKAAYFLREIGKGLGYLHDRGIVHRDLKPGNIFYEDGYVKIGDYGLSKFISVSQHSVQTASVGTVHYMAPEVGSGNYGRGVDIYALGVMLYEMLLGRVPYDGSSMGEVLMKHLMAQPEVDTLPAPFGEVITKALAKDPKDRYQTVDEMTEAVFGVDDIRDSVARFEPTSVSMAAARAVPAQVAAGVGGSSGEVHLPPTGGTVGAGSSGAGAWGRAGTARPEPGGEAQSWGDRWRQRREERRERIRDRLGEVEAKLRNLEGIRSGETPRFPPRSRWVAGLLGVFLGWLGIHRFYLGYTRIGVIQIVVTMFTGGSGGIWGFVEGILILCGVWCEDVYGRPLYTRRPRSPVRLNARWLERLLVAAVVAIALSAGVAVLFGGAAGPRDRSGVFADAFPTVLTFVFAMTAAAMAGSLVALRLRLIPAPPLLGRLVVFGVGLLALLGAAAFTEEFIRPAWQPFVMRYGEAWNNNAWLASRQFHNRMMESLVGGLAVAMLLLDWPRRLRLGSEGQVELGPAVWAGIVAGIASLFWNQDYFVLVAGIAATVSLTVQSAALFRLRDGRDGDDGPPGTRREPTAGETTLPTPPYQGGEPTNTADSVGFGHHDGGRSLTYDSLSGETPAHDARGPHHVPHAFPTACSERACTDRARRAWLAILAAGLGAGVTVALGAAFDMDADAVPPAAAAGAGVGLLIAVLLFGIYGRRRARRAAEARPVVSRLEDSGAPSSSPPAQAARTGSDFILRSPAGPPDACEPPLRSGAARIFWGVVAAAALCGAMMCIAAVAMVRLSNDEAAGCVAAALGLLASEVFPLSKVTRRRRRGVYGEWLRPLFIAVCLAAAGIAVAVLAGMSLHDDEAFVAIGFLVVGLVFALFFTIVRGSGATFGRPAADQTTESPGRSQRLKTGLAILGIVIALLGLLLVGTRTAVHSERAGHAQYESTDDGGAFATRAQACDACAKSVGTYLKRYDLVDWSPAGPFRLVVSPRTNIDQAARKQWDSALLGALRNQYPHAGTYDLQIAWEQRQTAAGAHWAGEGVGENEAVLDLAEQGTTPASPITISARLLAKARGSLYTIVIRDSYEEAARNTGR
jgi:hypothetical protein